MEVPNLTKDEQVREAIKSRLGNLRQTELAAKVELSWPQWQRRMSGSVPWRAEEVAAVARELGVSVDELMGER